MYGPLVRRLVQFPIVLALIYTVTFALISLAPGDPLIGENSKVPPEVLAQQRKLYRIDGPWHEQYLDYAGQALRSAARGELVLGYSIEYRGKPVAEILGLTPTTWRRGAMRTSLTLGGLALAIAVALGVNAGVIAAVRRNRLADHLVMAGSVLGVSLPTFVIGALLIWLLAIRAGWFPVGGWGDIRQMVLPAGTLAAPFAAYIARLTRASMLDTLSADYVRTARAKGVSEPRVIYRHALRLAFLPVLSYLGPAAAAIMTGSFVVERLFAIPGIGEHFTRSVLNRDQPLILGTVLVYSALLVTMNLIVDLLYVAVDPRIRQGGKS